MLTEIKILQQGHMDPELNQIGREQALVVWFICSNRNSELIIVCSSVFSNNIFVKNLVKLIRWLIGCQKKPNQLPYTLPI